MANDKWSGNNPWLGLAPYTEGTPLYGRTKESIQLADIIKDYMASVVFGKSGIGKSSLLSAGISPLLREENYIPVRIRLVHNTDVSYIEQVENKVRETVHCIDSLPSDVNNLGLWDFFHRHSFTTENGIDCIPVIILDQFEEIYTLTDADHKKEIITFFNELSSLLNDIKPDNVIEEERKHSAVQNGSDSVTPRRGLIKRSAASALNYTSATTFRFVICLREDKLYLLERNSSNIPSLKANRYNLQALSPESALEVIMCPRPELFSNEEATAIVDKLADMGDEGIRTVDPAILSLFLYKYYEKKGEANYDNIFADYYQEATKDIKGKSIAFLEDHLLTLGGYRNQVPLDDALSSGVAQSEIDSLLNQIILRTEKRKGIDYIEFSHDRLCAEAKKSRDDRAMAEEKRIMRKRLTFVILLAIVLFSAVLMFVWLYVENLEKAKEIDIKNYKLTEKLKENEQQQTVIQIQRDSLLHILNQYETQRIELQHSNLLLLEKLTENEKQKNEIEISKEELKHINDNLYRSLIKNKALSIASHLGEGRLYENVDSLLCLYPNDDNKIPYVPEVEQAIRMAYDSIQYGKGSLHRFVGSDCFRYAVFSPDDKYIAAGSNNYTITIWNSSTLKEVNTLRGHKDMVDCLNYSNDGRFIVSYAYDGTLIKWNAITGQKIFKVKLFDDDNRHSGRCEFSNSGDKIVVIISGIGCFVLDSKTGENIATHPHAEGTTSLSAHFIDNEDCIITNANRDIIVWHYKTSVIEHIFDKDNCENPIVSKDGSLIAFSNNDSIFVINRKGVLLEKVYLGKSTYEMDFSNDGRYIATATYDSHGLVNIIDIEANKIVYSQRENNALVLSAKFSRDNSYIVTACVDNSCRLLTTNAIFATPKITTKYRLKVDRNENTYIVNHFLRDNDSYRFEFDFCNNVYAINRSGDVAILDSMNVTIYNKQMSQKATLAMESETEFISISNDSRYLACASNDTIKKSTLVKIININTKQVISSFYTPLYIWRAQFCTGNKLWLTGNNSIFLYDPFTARCLAKAYGDEEDMIITNGLHHDGRHFLSYNPSDIDDMSLKVWNINNLSLVYKLSGFARKPEESEFSEDGKTIITSNYEDGVRLFDFLPIEEIIKTLKKLLGK